MGFSFAMHLAWANHFLTNAARAAKKIRFWTGANFARRGEAGSPCKLKNGGTSARNLGCFDLAKFPGERWAGQAVRCGAIAAWSVFLAGCAGAAEVARGYDRELVAGNRGGENFVEYRLSRNAEKLKTEKLKLEEQRELIRMVTQLLDELNAGKLPAGKSQISNLKSQMPAELAKEGAK